MMADNTKDGTGNVNGSSSYINPREDLLEVAVNFLNHPNIRGGSKTKKELFLKSKGLTDEEVKIAFERHETKPSKKQDDAAAIIGMPSAIPPPVPPRPQPADLQCAQKKNTTSNLSVFLGSAAIIAGLSYSLYLLYKKYIAPYVAARKKEKREARLDAAMYLSTIEELRACLSKIAEDVKLLQMQQQQQQDQRQHLQQVSQTFATAKHLEELKADVASVRALLLGRHQFAAPLPQPPLLGASIPTWQLVSETEDLKDVEGDGTNSKSTPEEDSNAGDSCETDVVTTNGSDSSMEVINRKSD